MRVFKFLMFAGLILAVTGMASAVTVALPAGSTMKLDAWGAFSEIFLDLQANNVLGMPAGTYNNVAIGYDKAANAGGGGFVLYTGASSSTVADPTPPTTTIPLPVGFTIQDIFTGKTAAGAATGTRGRMYVGGLVQSISTATDSVSYAKNALGVGGNTQLGFAAYNAYVSGITLSPVDGVTGLINTTFVLTAGTPNERLHFDVWADNTPDATLGGTVNPPGGQRYLGVPGAGVPPGSAIPELPVRDTLTDGSGLLPSLGDGTYYDRNGKGWPELAFAGAPADDDVVFWSWEGNPGSVFTVAEQFAIPGETFVDQFGNTIYVSGPSILLSPYVAGFGIVGQLVKGTSLVDPNGYTRTVVNPDGSGLGNNLLDNNPYILTANFDFGGLRTGAYDSDQNTFTFQQGDPGAIGNLTQLTGGLVPEPLTMVGLFLGLGGLGRYLRRRVA